MKSVLIVEDDLTISVLLQEGLEAEGYYVSGVARSVLEAKASAERYEPDFAVIDLRLAHGDLGTAVAADLRQFTKTAIIFSTGNDNDIHLIQSLGEAVMTKPYRIRDIGRGLKIIQDMALRGATELSFPRNFKLLVST
jgi:two-component system response regulator HydG